MCEELDTKVLNLFLSAPAAMTACDPPILWCCWTPAAPLMKTCSVNVLLALSISWD